MRVCPLVVMVYMYFDHFLHTNACQHYLTTGMFNSLFMDEGLLSIITAGCGKLVKMLKSLEPHGKFDYLYILLILVEKTTKKLKNIYRKNIGHAWIRTTAPGCWITRKCLGPLGHKMMYTLEHRSQVFRDPQTEWDRSHAF